MLDWYFRDASDKLVDHAANGRTIEEMKSFVMKQCGVTGIDSLRTRMFGAKMYVDIDIVADGNLTLFQAHRIADEVHDTIERHFPEVKHCMVHVSPIRKLLQKIIRKQIFFAPSDPIGLQGKANLKFEMREGDENMRGLYSHRPPFFGKKAVAEENEDLLYRG